MKTSLLTLTLIAALAVPAFADFKSDKDAAMLLMSQRKFAEAQAAFEKVIATYPANSVEVSQFSLANALGCQSKYAEAQSLYEKVIATATKPESMGLRATAQLEIGRLFDAQSKFSEAQAAFEKVVANYPKCIERSAVAQTYIGTVLVKQQKYAEARAAFEKTVATYPTKDSFEAAVKLHGMYSFKNEYVKAGNIVLFAGRHQVNTQQLRTLLNKTATVLNKMENAKNGKSISDATAFTKVNALITAENTGVGFRAAVEALGLTLPANYDAELAKTKKQRDDFLAGMGDVPSQEFLGRLEFYLGIDQTKAFGIAYNK